MSTISKRKDKRFDIEALWNMEYFYANDLFCLAPRKEQGCQGRSRRKQPADSKNCNNILFYCLVHRRAQ
jgi:hypothetical protein